MLFSSHYNKCYQESLLIKGFLRCSKYYQESDPNFGPDQGPGRSLLGVAKGKLGQRGMTRVTKTRQRPPDTLPERQALPWSAFVAIQVSGARVKVKALRGRENDSKGKACSIVTNCATLAHTRRETWTI